MADSSNDESNAFIPIIYVLVKYQAAVCVYVKERSIYKSLKIIVIWLFQTDREKKNLISKVANYQQFFNDHLLFKEKFKYKFNKYVYYKKAAKRMFTSFNFNILSCLSIDDLLF